MGRGWPGLRIRHPGAGHHTTAANHAGHGPERTHYAVLCGSRRAEKCAGLWRWSDPGWTGKEEQTEQEAS